MVKGPDSLVELVGSHSATVFEIFMARTRKNPDDIFLIWEDKHWSYAESYELCCSVANQLLSLCEEVGSGAKNNPRIVSYLSNRPEAIWLWLGTLFAGLVYVPLNRALKGGLLKEHFIKAEGSLFVSEQSAVENLEETFKRVNLGNLVMVDQYFEESNLDFDKLHPINWSGTDQKMLPAIERSADDLATIMFTSGTTGKSKGVCIPQNQYCRGAARIVDGFGLNSADVFHNWLPLCHLGGQLHMTITAVICGGTVALFPTFSRSAFWDQIEKTKSSVLCGFAAIMNLIWSLPGRKDEEKSSLRVGIIAGIPRELHKPFEDRFGIRLGENYGMTEADPLTLPGPSPWKKECSGFPNPDFEMQIRDAQGTVLKAGEIGEIYFRPRVKSVGFLGYMGNLNAYDHDEWCNTGDLGIIDQHGYLTFMGRQGSYIRHKGENISAEELREVLTSFEGIKECVAVGVPSDLGEEDVKVCYVLEPQSNVLPEQLHAYACQKLAKFMVPRYYAKLDKMPRNNLGKIILKELKDETPGTWDSLSR